jgi:Flp pilus assembly pilin Flp
MHTFEEWCLSTMWRCRFVDSHFTLIGSTLMKNLMKTFIVDEAGVIVSTEIILVVLLLVLGLIAGMASLRDQVVQELGDLGEAINGLDASYEFVGATYTAAGAANQNGGPATQFDDLADSNNVQTINTAPEGVNLDGHLDTDGVAAENGSQLP